MTTLGAPCQLDLEEVAAWALDSLVSHQPQVLPESPILGAFPSETARTGSCLRLSQALSGFSCGSL